MLQQSQVEARVPVLTTAPAACRICFPLQDFEVLRHIVEVLSGYLDTFSSRWTVKRACRAGLPRRPLDYLAAQGRDSDWGSDDDGTCGVAALAVRSGHQHVLQWINEHHPDSITWDDGYGLNLMEEAAEFGQLAVLEWLHATRREGCSNWAINEAAANGHLDIVQWLHEHRSEGCTSFAMNQAARMGHLAIVRFLHENRRPRRPWMVLARMDTLLSSSFSMRTAAKGAHVQQCVRLLQGASWRWSSGSTPTEAKGSRVWRGVLLRRLVMLQ
jgi:hypothetical protein